MNFIPIGSKQIAYVQYDDQAAQMVVQYHAGRTDTYTGIRLEEYQSLVNSCNPYDMIVKLTIDRHLQPATDTICNEPANLR